MTTFVPAIGDTVWVVTRERVRAGKAPFAVRVHQLVFTISEGVREPHGVYTDRIVYHSLDSLWPSREDAVRATQAIASFEQEAEDVKYLLITNKLTAARTCA